MIADLLFLTLSAIFKIKKSSIGLSIEDKILHFGLGYKVI